ncbi:MAG TPA: pyridoxamine 5'-phosphate oxidase family protein [Dehalococcoidia bacterium]|jgi:PPOX class probable F420-dependent enzyme|nr:pyridoxamine 5'-phosphate oxidase family protein [Dehalococcoidia bacterium]
MNDIEPSIAEYLRGHRVGVLATQGRRAPQQTLIAYHFDGNDLMISVRGFSQKAKNLRRTPDASLAVIDGSTQLIVRGRIEIVSDSGEVLRLNQERMRQISTRQETDDELADRLRREERVILRLVPERFYPTSMS